MPRPLVRAVLLSVGVVCLVEGCGLPSNEVPFILDTALGVFDVQAGVPDANTGSLSEPDGVLGTLSELAIEPGELTVTPDAGGVGKGSVSQQIVDACLIACLDAGVDAIRCSNVCQGRELDVTVWIVSVNEADAVCGEGDGFGPYRVSLDAANAVVDVQPSSLPLTDSAVDLIEANDARVCIEVIAPIDSRVRISSLTFLTAG